MPQLRHILVQFRPAFLQPQFPTLNLHDILRKLDLSARGSEVVIGLWQVFDLFLSVRMLVSSSVTEFNFYHKRVPKIIIYV